MQSNTLYANIKLSIPSDLLVSTSSSSGLDDQLFRTLHENAQTQSFVEESLFLEQPYELSPTISTFSNLQSASPVVYSLPASFVDLVYGW